MAQIQLDLAMKKTHRCSICSKIFTKKRNLARHQILHSGVKNFGCSQCDKTFNQAQNLIRHELTHYDADKLFSCNTCSKKFIDQNNLRKHELSHIQASSDANAQQSSGFLSMKYPWTKNLIPSKGHYDCSNCDKTFTYASVLKIHKKLHRNNNLHGEVTTQAGNDTLEAGFDFEATESKYGVGRLEYNCSHCDKTFSHFGVLKVHEELHTKLDAQLKILELVNLELASQFFSSDALWISS